MQPLTVPGVLDSLEPVGKYVMGAASEAGLEKGSAYKLRLAVDEIVTNIIIHGYEESGLTGDVALSAEQDDGMLRLIVEDTAVPFDPRQLARPDDLDKPLEERQMGGLGVYLVFENVDGFEYEHDGTHNRNIFIINRPSASPPATKVRLLVADDDKARQDSVTALLGRAYALSFVEDPDKVIAGAAANDLVMLNVLANRVHPYKVLRRLKGGEGSSPRPVVVVAPGDSVESVSRCLEMGADDFLLEPLHLPLVQARVNAVLDLQRLRERLVEEEAQDERAAAALKASEKYERDVLIGRQIQQGFLPKTVPDLVGWEITGRFQPAREVAGDWWDAFSLEHIRRVGLVIADVCDKGVGAALFMALMRSLIRAFAQIPSSLRWLDALDSSGPLATARAGGSGGITAGRRREAPTAGSTALRNAIEQTNNYIAHNHGDTGMFATLFFGILDPATGLVQYINGGHEPPIVIASNGTIKQRLKPTGMAVGMMEGSPYEAQSIQLDPGDMLLTYTDGVPEARDPERKFFTEERLLELIRQPAGSASAMLDRILDNLRAHIADADQFDDITMLAVRRS